MEIEGQVQYIKQSIGEKLPFPSNAGFDVVWMSLHRIH